MSYNATHNQQNIKKNAFNESFIKYAEIVHETRSYKLPHDD